MDPEELKREIEQLRRSNRELTLLRDLAHAMSLSNKIDDLIEAIVSKAIRAVSAEQGAIILLEEGTGEGKTLYRSMATSGPGIALGLDQMLVGWMGVHKKPLNLPDPMSDPRFRGVAWDDTTRSLACVPLLVQSDVIGTLAVFNKKKAEAFSDDDIRLLDIIAAQSAQVVENARLSDIEELHEMLKMTQSQMIQSERSAALGSLVAGLLHELNNAFGAIQNSGGVVATCLTRLRALIDSGKSQSEIADEMKRYIATLEQVNGTVQKASPKVSRVLTALKSVSDTDGTEKTDVDIHGQIEDVLILLQPDFDERVEVIKEFGDIPAIHGNRGEIGQVWLHLLSNASKAIDSRGTITIRTHREDNDVIVNIIDTGRGIAQSQLRNLFDPSFTKLDGTVKARLGLFVCSNIIHKHRGQIKADSKLGHGATFTATLPIS